MIIRLEFQREDSPDCFFTYDVRVGNLAEHGILFFEKLPGGRCIARTLYFWSPENEIPIHNKKIILKIENQTFEGFTDETGSIIFHIPAGNGKIVIEENKNNRTSPGSTTGPGTCCVLT